MESLTKNYKDQETLNKLVQKAFKDVHIDKFTELTEGYFNVAYLINLSNGNEVILKIAPPSSTKVMRYEKNIMKAEVEVMRLVRKNTKVPVPEILFYDDTHSICDSDYFFMAKLDGSSYSSIKDSLTEDEKKAIEFKLGQYNKKINEIINDRFGYFAQEDKQNVSWSETFYNFVSDLINDAIDIGTELPMDSDAILSLVKSNLYVCDDVLQPKLVHWDLWDGNVFVNKGEIVGIIDFERAIWGDPLMEYYFSNLASSAEFNSGYNLIELDDNAKKRRILYNIYLFLVMTIECDYRHNESGQREWAKDMLKQELDKLL